MVTDLTGVSTAVAAVAEPPGIAVQLGSTALALAFVLLLAWLGLRALKRLQAGRAGALGTGVPQLLHSVSLGPRERLVSVRYRGREYLLGVTPATITVIDGDVRAESPPATTAAAARVDPPCSRP